MQEPTLTPEDGWAELRAVLDEELERLADKYRVLVVLCDLQGRTRREVAGLLGLPEGTVASRLATARAMLAKRILGRGLVLAGGSVAGVLSAGAASAAVPGALFTNTIKAASLFAAGGRTAAAGAISAKAVALAEGVLKTMLISKLKVMAVVLLAAGLVAASGASVAYQANGWEQSGETTQRIVKSAALVKGRQEPPKDAKSTQPPPKSEQTQEEKDPHLFHMELVPI